MEVMMRILDSVIGFGLGVGTSALVASALSQQAVPLLAERRADPTEKYAFWLMAFTGVLALATVSLGVYAAKQARDIKQYVSATRSIADAAKKSSDIAEASLVKLQRASVFVADFNWNWHPDTTREGKFWYHFRPILQNSGNTQTKEMITKVVFDLRDNPLPQDFRFPPNIKEAPAIVPPRGSVFGATGTLTDDELINVQDGTKFFYIYGIFTYNDIFDGTPIHTTTFCRQVTNILGNVHKPNTEVVEMFFSIVFPKYNTAD
jgi:hypothetical protein